MMNADAHMRMTLAEAELIDDDEPVIITWPDYDVDGGTRGDATGIGTGITGHVHPNTPAVHIVVNEPAGSPGDIWIERDFDEMVDDVNPHPSYPIRMFDGSRWVLIS